MKSIVTPEYRKYTQGSSKVPGRNPKYDIHPYKITLPQITNKLNNLPTTLPKLSGNSHKTGGNYAKILSSLKKLEKISHLLHWDKFLRLRDELEKYSEKEISNALIILQSEDQNLSLFDYIESTINYHELSNQFRRADINNNFSLKIKQLERNIDRFVYILQNESRSINQEEVDKLMGYSQSINNNEYSNINQNSKWGKKLKQVNAKIRKELELIDKTSGWEQVEHNIELNKLNEEKDYLIHMAQFDENDLDEYDSDYYDSDDEYDSDEYDSDYFDTDYYHF
jgi:hypothetical protein